MLVVMDLNLLILQIISNMQWRWKLIITHKSSFTLPRYMKKKKKIAFWIQINYRPCFRRFVYRSSVWFIYCIKTKKIRFVYQLTHSRQQTRVSFIKIEFRVGKLVARTTLPRHRAWPTDRRPRTVLILFTRVERRY